jgi:hypothetical protein
VSELLAIYLRDHHAAGSAGVALARRAAEHAELPAARLDQLAAVAAEIAEDLRSLESVMAGLEISPSAVKDTVATVGERVGRLKLNGSVLTRSRLSTVLELETLVAGITAKQALWKALAILSEAEPALDADELGRLEQRAGRQRKVVEACRLEAVRAAFVASPGAAAR